MMTCREIYTTLFNEHYKVVVLKDEDKRRRVANIYAVKNTAKKWREQYEDNK